MFVQVNDDIFNKENVIVFRRSERNCRLDLGVYFATNCKSGKKFRFPMYILHVISATFLGEAAQSSTNTDPCLIDEISKKEANWNIHFHQ